VARLGRLAPFIITRVMERLGPAKTMAPNAVPAGDRVRHP